MSRTSPRARRLTKRYYVTLSRGERIHCLSLRPASLYALATSAALLLAVGAAGAVGFFSHADLSLQAMRAQQEEMQAAYDDRLAALREQMDATTLAKSRERQALEAQMRELASRQQTLESRAAAISRLAQNSRARLAPTGSIHAQSGGDGRVAPVSAPAMGAPGDLVPLPNARPAAAPESTQAFAPAAGAASGPLLAKPRPDGVELQSDRARTSELAPGEEGAPLRLRLADLDADANRVQSEQLAAVAQLAVAVAQSAAKVREALAETGLSVDRVRSKRRLADADEPMGGPYVPVRLDVGGSAMENEFDKLQDEIMANERLAAELPYLPIGRPLRGPLDTTSPFGIRVDPFLGRLAIHPGNDFRAAVGEPALATADGKVTMAGYDGGYGNMVEIDHGDGLATRYAHLSAIDVRIGQKVSAGDIVGRTGSTGRATGPHLHYEVRIDGKPVNPLPFVRAGESILASK